MRLIPIVVLIPPAALDKLTTLTEQRLARMEANVPGSLADVEAMCAQNGWTIEGLVGGMLLADSIRSDNLE